MSGARTPGSIRFRRSRKPYNCNSVPPQNATDGIVQVASTEDCDLGNSVRLWKYPRHPQFFPPGDRPQTQQEFLALDLNVIGPGRRTTDVPSRSMT
jgi:hypothetical protein